MCCGYESNTLRPGDIYSSESTRRMRVRINSIASSVWREQKGFSIMQIPSVVRVCICFTVH